MKKGKENAKNKQTNKNFALKVKPTVAGVSDTVLQDSEPLLLLFLGGHAEVVVVGVRVPEDQGELAVALNKGRTPHLGFYICIEKKKTSSCKLITLLVITLL